MYNSSFSPHVYTSIPQIPKERLAYFCPLRPRINADYITKGVFYFADFTYVYAFSHAFSYFIKRIKSPWSSYRTLDFSLFLGTRTSFFLHTHIQSQRGLLYFSAQNLSRRPNKILLPCWFLGATARRKTVNRFPFDSDYFLCLRRCLP